MNKRHVIIQHPCHFVRYGILELLDQRFPESKQQIVSTASDLSECYALLQDGVQPDIVFLSLEEISYSLGDMLSLITHLQSHLPACQVVILSDESQHFSQITHYLNGLSNVSTLLNITQSLEDIEKKITTIFSKPFNKNRLSTNALQLSTRELSVLCELLNGYTMVEIAQKMGLSYKTVSHYKCTAQFKLGISSLRPLIINSYDRRTMNQWLHRITRPSATTPAKSSVSS